MSNCHEYIRPAYSSETGVITSLYVNYLKELSPYDDAIPKNDKEIKHMAKEMVIEYAESSHTTIYVIVKTEIIGFFVVGQWPQAYATDDVYIMQFYISKPYQRKGYGKTAVKLFTESTEFYNLTDDISLFVLFGNPASYFWTKIFKELGYKDLVKTGKIAPPTEENMDELPNARFYYFSAREGV